VAIYAKTIGAIYVVCFFMGLILVGKMTVGFVWLMELVPTQHQVIAGLCVLTGYPLAIITSSFVLVFVSRDVGTLLQLGFFLNIIFYSIAMLIPESPHWLVTQKEF
jgi:hypothetical protein